MLTRSQRICRKKIEYKGKRPAKRRARYYAKHNGAELKPYRCKECVGWHLARKA